MYSGANTVEHFTPWNATSDLQPKRLKHHVILIPHLLLRPISVQDASDRLPVRTGSAHSIGGIENFDHGLRMLCKNSMDRSHVLDEPGTITYPAKPLQAQEGMGSETNRRGHFVPHQGVGQGDDYLDCRISDPMGSKPESGKSE